VANDTTENFLYLNKSTRGRIRLEEVGLTRGVASDDFGRPNGSMGVDAADYLGRGWPSIWVTNYESELHALYYNQGKGMFLYNTQGAGLAAIGQRYVGFGTAFLDFDNDGWEDLAITNGHVIRHPRSAELRQKPVLFHNQGNGKFADVTADGGPYFHEGHRGRGLVMGDLDNDGWPDLVLSPVNEPVTVLRNEAAQRLVARPHWLGVTLATPDHRDVVGAKVILEAGGRRQTRFAKGGGSYCSSGDRRHLFGLGPAEHIDRLTVVWPSGKQQRLDGGHLAVDRYWRVVEGKAKPVEERGNLKK
jgi:hypothetical protein